MYTDEARFGVTPWGESGKWIREYSISGLTEMALGCKRERGERKGEGWRERERERERERKRNRERERRREREREREERVREKEERQNSLQYARQCVYVLCVCVRMCDTLIQVWSKG